MPVPRQVSELLYLNLELFRQCGIVFHFNSSSFFTITYLSVVTGTARKKADTGKYVKGKYLARFVFTNMCYIKVT